jgi:hypothetical protein
MTEVGTGRCGHWDDYSRWPHRIIEKSALRKAKRIDGARVWEKIQKIGFVRLHSEIGDLS